MIDTLRLTAEEATGLLERGDVSGAELLAAYRDAIAARDPELHAFLRTVDEPEGEGVPIALKDVIGTKGVETTAGSKILSGYKPVYDATVAARCKKAGLPLLGKDVDEVERMRRRRHVRQVELGHLPDRLEDRVQLPAEPLDLVLAQVKARQSRYMQYVVSLDRHLRSDLPKKKGPFRGPHKRFRKEKANRRPERWRPGRPSGPEPPRTRRAGLRSATCSRPS